ncbi:MAG: polyphosphate polymerase domain-containing protein [Actinomycetia bacterium]|nr:polyphosphate polymerase domain-containing protein [Actinomycetes bacterium]
MDKNYRHELKYYINYLDYLKLADRIKGVFTRDIHCQKSGYAVRSLYFDNKSNHSYYHKIAGISERNKYRVRLYDLNPHPIKLEIKSKSDNYIYKQSVAITRDQVFDLMSGRYRFLLGKKHLTANLVYAEFSKDRYHPAVVVDYFRDAYFYNTPELRVTFDRFLGKNETDFGRFFQSDLVLDRLLGSKKMIMEIKYRHNIPVWIKKILQVGSFESCAISKYTLSRYIEG